MRNDQIKLLSRSLKRVNSGLEKLEKEKDSDISPQELHFELTHSCNSKCIMCDIWNKYHRDPQLKREEITLKEIVNFVEKSDYLKKLKLVLFSGGEPFLREDIVAICGYFIQKFPSISVGILTNCFDTELTLNRIKEIMDKYSPRDLWIGSSLDGIGERHDEIRGVKGSFNALIKTLDLIKKEFSNIKISLNFTLTTRNYFELLPSFKLAKERGLDFSAQFAIPWRGVEKFAWDKVQLQEIRQQVEIIMEEIAGNCRSESLPHLYYWNGLVAYQEQPQRFFKRCVAGARYAMLSPFGDLYFCPILKHSIVGNIRKNDFDALWVSREASDIRDSINKGLCHCWLNCTVYPNVAEALAREQPVVKRNLITALKFLRRI